MAKTIRIAGIDFNANFLNAYMRTIFGESFAHSSLSFEKVFKESKKYEALLQQFISKDNIRYAQILGHGDQDDLSLLKQRYNEIEGALIHFGIPRERKEDEELGAILPSAKDFARFFPGAVRPYRNSVELRNAREAGLLTGEDYETETVYERSQMLYKYITEKLKADRAAYELKKGNNEAFAYARNVEHLGIPEIIEINTKVNNETGIHKGFKTSDNEIMGAPFLPCPKEQVPMRMQELVYKYEHEWADEIPPFIEGIHTTAQKNAHLRAICEREAKFHIEFERIHPFEDGNGRTGRIILNSNLIKHELAPILITPEMHDLYIEYIDTNNYKALGQLIFMLSSVTLTEMVSHYRKVRGIDPDQLGLHTPSREFSGKSLTFKYQTKKDN
jgi:hypothetical protein